MAFYHSFLKFPLCQQAGDGSEGGTSGGQGQPEKTFTQADLDKAIAEQVAGLKNKNSELIGKEKELKAQLARFEGIDPDSVRAILKNFADQEEAQLIAQGKIDDVLAKRTQRMKNDYDKTVSKLQGDLDEKNRRLTKFADRALSASVREVGANLSIHPSAFDDALLRAKSVFEIDDEGNAIAKDGVFGKDGKPLTLLEWFDSMKETAPHWFPAPTGGGSQSSSRGSTGAPKSLFDCQTDEERVAYLKNIAK